MISNALSIFPEATVSWAEDVSGNAIATAVFASTSDFLSIECHSELQLDSPAWPVFDIAYSAMSYPFSYSEDEWIDLGPLGSQQYADLEFRLRDWAQGFIRGASTNTLALLKDMCAGVSAWISYAARHTEGTQTPLQTLEARTGTCRDLAVLIVEAVRSIGFGARIVSGYLYDPERSPPDSADPGSTHAWAEVYVPGAGWISFDPTTGSVGGVNLIPVAVGRDIAQVMPVAGKFSGMNDAFEGMTVEVSVSANSG